MTRRMRALRAGTPDGDRGMTLVELTISIALLGIVTAAVTGAIIFGLKATNDTFSRLEQNMSSQQVNRWLTGDIYASEASTTSSAVCGPANLALSWRSSATAASTDRITSWYLNGTSLVRKTCTSAGAAVGSSKTIATGIDQFTATVAGNGTVTVTYRAAASGKSKAQTWSVTATPIKVRGR